MNAKKEQVDSDKSEHRRRVLAAIEDHNKGKKEIPCRIRDRQLRLFNDS